MPTTAHRRPGWACALACLCATAAACSGCGGTLCPSTTFPAAIYVSLQPVPASAVDMLVTVSCPAAAECGFLDGPATGSADSSVMITTVLRPPEVDVVVTERTGGAVLLHDRLLVEYRPVGTRQTDCGGDAEAVVLVPAD